jgi:hypothetical protein
LIRFEVLSFFNASFTFEELRSLLRVETLLSLFTLERSLLLLTFDDALPVFWCELLVSLLIRFEVLSFLNASFAFEERNSLPIRPLFVFSV